MLRPVAMLYGENVNAVDLWIVSRTTEKQQLVAIFNGDTAHAKQTSREWLTNEQTISDSPE